MRRGFTLMELLIAVAIIGILAAMFLPALGAIREAGKRTACANQLRQWGIALASYAGSERGQVPQTARDGRISPHLMWYAPNNPATGLGEWSWATMSAYLDIAVVRNSGSFKVTDAGCPAQRFRRWTFAANQVQIGYSYFGQAQRWAALGDAAPDPSNPLTEARLEPGRLLMSENVQFLASIDTGLRELNHRTDRGNYGQDKNPTAQLAGSNCLFGELRVAWHSRTDFNLPLIEVGTMMNIDNRNPGVYRTGTCWNFFPRPATW